MGYTTITRKHAETRTQKTKTSPDC